MRIEIKFSRKNLYCINSQRSSTNCTCSNMRMDSPQTVKVSKEMIQLLEQISFQQEISNSRQAWKKINLPSQMGEICSISQSQKVNSIKSIFSSLNSTRKKSLRNQKSCLTGLESVIQHGESFVMLQWDQTFTIKTGSKSCQMKTKICLQDSFLPNKHKVT